MLRVPTLILISSSLLAFFISEGPLQKRRDLDCIRAQSGFLTDPSSVPPPDFPRDLSKVTLTLFQSGCFGECPSFRMTVRAGWADFEGWAYVRKKGKKRARLKPGEFEALVRALHEGRLDAMRDRYCGYSCPDGSETIVVDAQKTAIELVTPEFTKEVFECFHTISGEPSVPQPPKQYFEVKKLLLKFAKAKGWL
jgi:hypothetical protein